MIRAKPFMNGTALAELFEARVSYGKVGNDGVV